MYDIHEAYFGVPYEEHYQKHKHTFPDDLLRPEDLEARRRSKTVQESVTSDDEDLHVFKLLDEVIAKEEQS